MCRAIQKADCYHKHGRDADCDEFGGNFFMLLFGLVQVFMSQIPDFQSMVLVSVVAAIMSFVYSSIGFGLGLAQVIENGKIAGNVTGVPAASVTDKLLQTFQALGDIAFSYPYAVILLEIQDTVKSPPAENKVTKRASAIATFLTGFFYLGCGCFGYAAFGNDTPGNLLTGPGFSEPYWLVDFANVCIIIHLLGGYQLYSQPIYAFVERGLTEKFLDNQFAKRNHELKLPLLPVIRFNMLRLCVRTTYVATTIAVSVLFPFFNEITAATGALNLWPLAIYFPVEMYIVQKKVETWSRKWIVLEIFNGVLMIISLMALVASVAGLIEAKMKE
ncbi:putative amino acid permease 7 [Bidens hawaiensis]|uniref:putative amino acid permease 7 n=1 Tax=Bidens hawaiensis TaxID=980011 RepID=UPI004049BE61